MYVVTPSFEWTSGVFTGLNPYVTTSGVFSHPTVTSRMQQGILSFKEVIPSCHSVLARLKSCHKVLLQYRLVLLRHTVSCLVLMESLQGMVFARYLLVISRDEIPLITRYRLVTKCSVSSHGTVSSQGTDTSC